MWISFFFHFHIINTPVVNSVSIIILKVHFQINNNIWEEKKRQMMAIDTFRGKKEEIKDILSNKIKWISLQQQHFCGNIKTIVYM